MFRTTVVKDFEFILDDEYGLVGKQLTIIIVSWKRLPGYVTHTEFDNFV